MKHFWVDTGWACGYVGVDDSGRIVESAPIFRKWPTWAGFKPKVRKVVELSPDLDR